MKIGIIDLCKQIEDPRMNRKKVHKMETIIYISIAAESRKQTNRRYLKF